MTVLENGNISPFDCGVGWRSIYIYQRLYLKLDRFIVYLIFDWVCGMKKGEGRVEEEWAPFAVNLGLQLALPSVREEQGGVQIELGWHSAWFVVAYDAGNYKQCWIGYKSLEEALQCFSYVPWAWCQKISCCCHIKSMARNNLSRGRFLSSSPSWQGRHSGVSVLWLVTLCLCQEQRKDRSRLHPQWPTSPSNAPP